MTKRLKTAEEVEQYFPGFKAFIDVTEQQIPRPNDKRRKRLYYSGKRKRHTVKQEVMVNTEGKILYKARCKAGHNHDYKIYKANHPVTPKEVENVFDLGFLGVEKGEGPVILEAMKMYNEIKSPIKGKIKDIRKIKMNRQVGDVMIVFE